MPLLHAISLISLAWVLVHLLYRLCKPKAPLLPTFNNAPTSRASRSWATDNSISTTVTVNKVQLRIETSAFNSRHEQLAFRLRDRRSKRLRKWVTTFYNAGVVAGICGLVLGLLTLLWITGDSLLARILLQSSKLSSHDKRALDVEGSAQFNAQNYIWLVIPGLTVPWTHLPLIIIAVSFCQIVHEIGHAVAGALYSVPILSSGLTVTLIIPSAFVSFSTALMGSLDAFSKAQIIAAGPWHNFLLWIFLIGLGKSASLVENATGLGTALVNLGWEDLSKEGRVVVEIDNDSPLNAVLKVGSVITALDDVSLAGEQDKWSQYLMPPSSIDVPWYGWCVSRELFQADSADCCKNAHPTLDHLCFDSLGHGKGCLNPIPILSTSHDQFRCRTGGECHDDALCVQPDSSSSSILRLSVQGQDLTLWNGPKKEVWEQVIVDRYTPRFWFIPSSATGSLNDFWSYLQMATLSLFMFNLLPLPFLDGAQLLNALINHAYPVVEPETIDMESGRRSSSSTGSQWKRRIERLVQTGTVCLVVVYFMLGVWALV
ncbi:peptidase family M50-domain-containing protein [Lentinula raphanica]|nr:peptidase family M50-domain-containing protein [Lentinula raphanica]